MYVCCTRKHRSVPVLQSIRAVSKRGNSGRLCIENAIQHVGADGDRRGTDYAICIDGEIPEVGNYLKNEWEQPGRVTRIHAAQDGQEQISVRWHDGGITLLFVSLLLLPNLRARPEKFVNCQVSR